MKKISKCLLCDSSLRDSHKILIKNIPHSAQGFSKNESKIKRNFSSYLFQCKCCNHVQLDSIPVEYYKEVVRSVGISKEMKSYRKRQFEEIRKDFFNNSKKIKVLEIGSASGEYSEILSHTFDQVIATEKGEKNIQNNQKKGIHCINTHPDDFDFSEKLKEFGKFDFICCFSYLEHLPNPKRTMLLLNEFLKEDGFYLIELPNSEMIFKRGLLNEVIPDHLSYFTINTSTSKMSKASIEVIKSSCTWQNYIISLICRKMDRNPLTIMQNNYQSFENKVNYLFKNKKFNHKKIVIWGAGHQSLFTISTSILGKKASYIVDSSPSKQGLYAPGSGLKVYSPNKLKTNIPDILIIACAGYNSEVKKMLDDMNLQINQIFLLDGLDLIKV